MAKSTAEGLLIPVDAPGLVTKPNTLLQSTTRIADETLFLFGEQKAKTAQQRTRTLSNKDVPNQHSKKLHGAKDPAFIVDLVAAIILRSSRPVLVHQRTISVNNKTKIFWTHAQKRQSQIGKLLSTANPSVCPLYLSNGRRWHALVNKTHLATPFRPRLLRQPVPLLSRGHVIVDHKRTEWHRPQAWRFFSSWLVRCLLHARAESAHSE